MMIFIVVVKEQKVKVIPFITDVFRNKLNTQS